MTISTEAFCYAMKQISNHCSFSDFAQQHNALWLSIPQRTGMDNAQLTPDPPTPTDDWDDSPKRKCGARETRCILWCAAKVLHAQFRINIFRPVNGWRLIEQKKNKYNLCLNLFLEKLGSCESVLEEKQRKENSVKTMCAHEGYVCGKCTFL